MSKSLNWFWVVFVSMVGSFFSYKIYSLLNDWQYTIAFLGGALTMILTVSLIDSKNTERMKGSGNNYPIQKI